VLFSEQDYLIGDEIRAKEDNAYKVSVRKPVRKGSLGRYRHGLYNIKMDLKDTGRKAVDILIGFSRTAPRVRNALHTLKNQRNCEDRSVYTVKHH
jgi:hypothetical protein